MQQQYTYRRFTALLVGWLGLCHVAESSALRALLTDARNEWSPKTTMSFPDSPEFTNATLRWSVYAPPVYDAAISPGTESDVVKCVKLATSHGIPFLATGGRHGYTTTLARLHHGLAIDLSNLNSVEMHHNAGTVTVGGGARVAQIFDPVYNAGFELQTISSQCPGVIGGTLGAGIGRDGGRYGLMIDALLSVRIVTADARLIEASESSHADLFWAIRGAGANFGVVTSATYRLNKVAHQRHYNGWVTNFDLVFSDNTTAAYFNAIVHSFHGCLPAKLSALNIVMYDGQSDKTLLVANWVYFGPEAEARKALSPILDLQPTTVSIKFVPWNRLADTTLQGADRASCPGGRAESIYGASMRKMSASTYQAAFDKMVRFYANHPEGRKSMLSLEMFPNEAARGVSDAATAYPWRDAVAHSLVLLVDAGEAGDELGRQLRHDFATSSGYHHLAVYVNYAHGDETLEQIYGRAKLPRLASIKRKWDPSNVFAFNNALPTQYP